VQGGVVAVLTSSPTDVLSHVAIRARSQDVLLATCFDEQQLESIKVCPQIKNAYTEAILYVLRLAVWSCFSVVAHNKCLFTTLTLALTLTQAMKTDWHLICLLGQRVQNAWCQVDGVSQD
jgi:hypothetical protein